MAVVTNGVASPVAASPGAFTADVAAPPSPIAQELTAANSARASIAATVASEFEQRAAGELVLPDRLQELQGALVCHGLPQPPSPAFPCHSQHCPGTGRRRERDSCLEPVHPGETQPRTLPGNPLRPSL